MFATDPKSRQSGDSGLRSDVTHETDMSSVGIRSGPQERSKEGVSRRATRGDGDTMPATRRSTHRRRCIPPK